MINSVEGSREIKETYSLLTHRLNDVVMNSEKCRLSRMMLGVGRLECVEEIVICKMQSEAIFNYSLSEFR